MIIYRLSATDYDEDDDSYGMGERLEINSKSDYLWELNLASEMQNGTVSGQGPYVWYYKTKSAAQAALKEHEAQERKALMDGYPKEGE